MPIKTLTTCCLTLSFSTLLMAQWQPQIIETDASFRSMHLVDKKIIWAGGTKSTVLKSTDGGENWQVLHLAGALDFRGIHAFDNRTAIVMSAGEAEKGAAKIFKTTNAGASWKEVFSTREKGVFLDCLRFRNATTGYALGDPIDGKPYILKTTDGGDSWNRIDPGAFPDVLPGEASFASSNSNISLRDKTVRFSTHSRIFISENEGATWQVFQTPFKQGSTAGIFGIYFMDPSNGFAVGGDYVNDKADYPNIARTTDGGQTWQFTATALPHGLKESVWRIKKNHFIAVGTSGTSRSTDGGQTWQAVDNLPYHVVQCKGKTCFAIGGNGQLGKWSSGISRVPK